MPADVSRFTELYAAEHETDKAVGAAKARYAALSDDVELLQLQLVDLIRERYQQVCCVCVCWWSGVVVDLVGVCVGEWLCVLCWWQC